MLSYPRRLPSGHFTCYLNRTYHVLTTFTYFPLDMEDLEAYVAGRLAANGNAKLPWRSRPRGFHSPTSPVKLSRTVFSHGASAGAKNSRVVPATFGGVSALPYKSTSGESRRNASPGSGPKC